MRVITILSTLLLAVMTIHTLAAEGETIGPNGEKPVPAASLTITAQEEAQIRSGNYTAALVWHEMSEYTRAVNEGAVDEFRRLGIEIVAQTDANFDASRQKSDVETVLARNPSIIISLPVEPTSAATVYDAALEAGVRLVFIDNSPTGYNYGRDYVTIVSDDLFQMGNNAARAMAQALDGKGTVGMIFHDADFYVTNQRDQAFKTVIEQDYPDMRIVATSGMADPARSDEVASAMVLQNPELDGIYVTWAEPALSVLTALRQAGNRHTKIVTLDLNEPAALDMIKGGNIAALVGGEAYSIGVTAARAAALSLVDKSLPPFLVVDSQIVMADNIEEGWKKSLNEDLPSSIVEAMK